MKELNFKIVCIGSSTIESKNIVKWILLNQQADIYKKTLSNNVLALDYS